jgi:hypothetical protein
MKTCAFVCGFVGLLLLMWQDIFMGILNLLSSLGII